MKTINDYAELVKEKHALNKTIAPVETDLTDASREYHIGEQFIINGGLFKAKTEIAQHDALVLNTNYEPADNLTEQIKNAGGGTGTDPRLDVFENNIAPVETDETDASRAYQVGEQLILDNILYDVIAPISEHDVITTTGSGANIEPADPISLQFQTLTNNVDVLIENGAVNKLPNNAVTQTINGVTFTVNTDPSSEEYGAVTITTESGGSTALTQLILFEGVANWHNMVLSGAPSTASATTYDLSAYDTQTSGENSCRPNDVVLTNITDGHTIRVFIRVRSGQVITEPITFKPMIADANYTGGYIPYAKTNQELTAENQTLTNNLDAEIEIRAKLGAHNWLPLTLSRIKALNTTGTWNNNVYSINNLTITFNDDLSISVNGIPSVNTELQLSDMFSLPAGVDFVMEGTPASGGAEKYWWYLKNRTPSDTSVKNMNPTESGNVLHFTADATNHYYRAQLFIWASQAINATFYPLIRLASDPSTAYAPYAMTNRELTEIKEISVTLNSTYFNNTATAYCYKIGHIVWLNISGVTIAEIPAGNIDLTTGGNLPSSLTGGVVGFMWSPTSGNILGQIRMEGNVNYPFNSAVPSGTNIKINIMYLTA